MAEYKDVVKDLVKGVGKDQDSVKELAEAILSEKPEEIKRVAQKVAKVDLSDADAKTLAADKGLRGVAEAEA